MAKIPIFTDISKLLMTVISRADNSEEKILNIRKIKSQNAKPCNQHTKLCIFLTAVTGPLSISLSTPNFRAYFVYKR